VVALSEGGSHDFSMVEGGDTGSGSGRVLKAYLKGIQDVGVFVSTAFSILTFFGQTVVVCQSYNAGLRSPPQ